MAPPPPSAVALEESGARPEGKKTTFGEEEGDDDVTVPIFAPAAADKAEKRKRTDEEKAVMLERAAKVRAGEIAKSDRAKPPEFYTCKACGVSGHWIYDCDKYTAPKAKEASAPKSSTVTKAAAAGGGGGKAKAADSSDDDGSDDDGSDDDDDSDDEQGGRGDAAGDNREKKMLVGKGGGAKVFVSGLPFDASADSITGKFEGCGPVEHVKLVKFGDSKKCRGEAFITFHNPKGAAKAVADMNNVKMGGGDRFLKVVFAKATRGKKKSPSQAAYFAANQGKIFRPGGRGGNRGGGGGGRGGGRGGGGGGRGRGGDRGRGGRGRGVGK